MYERIEHPNRGLAYDFISLYLSIMVYGEFPVGHPAPRDDFV